MFCYRIITLLIIGIAVFVPFSTASAQELWETIDASIELHEDFIEEYFSGNVDMDNDGLIDYASLKLIEAVASLNPVSDLYDATNNAYEANLAIFDLEPSARPLKEYRELIATLMIIGYDMQSSIAVGTYPLLSGDYVSVECSGAVCVPDAVPGKPVSETFEVFTFDMPEVYEPYTATGDLDIDETDNYTEYNNVMDQNGSTTDFTIAATSSTLNGTTTTGGTSSTCFIATAAYGTPMAQEIDVLRDFRDTHLLGNSLGSAFVDAYYRMSPPVADTVATTPALRAAVRMVLAPVIWIVQVPWLGLSIMFALILMLTRKPLKQLRRQLSS